MGHASLNQKLMLANKSCHCLTEALSVQFKMLSNDQLIIDTTVVHLAQTHAQAMSKYTITLMHFTLPGGRPGSDERWIRGGRMKRPSPADRRGLGARLRTTSTGGT